MSKLIEFHTSNKYILLYVNYTSVELVQKIKANLVRTTRKAKFETWLNKAGIGGILYLQTIANSCGVGKEAKG